MNDDDRPKTETETRYLAYMLRLWRTDQSGTACWRASLEVSHSGHRIGFASLEELYAYLVEQLERHQ